MKEMCSQDLCLVAIVSRPCTWRLVKNPSLAGIAKRAYTGGSNLQWLAWPSDYSFIYARGMGNAEGPTTKQVYDLLQEMGLHQSLGILSTWS